jgi:secretion/DNA translocation related CpaE-like protein
MNPTTSRLGAAPRALLATADPDRLDDLLRLAAGAGVAAEVAARPEAVRPCWQTVPLVLVGADLVTALAALHLPRRDGVIVVGTAAEREDPRLWQAALEVAAAEVVLLPEDEQLLVTRLASSERADGHGVVLAVVGGRGGAGASVLAAALAVAAQRAGHRGLLVDADPWGSGADLLLGGEQLPGLRWPDLVGLEGSLDGGALGQALPCPYGVPVVAWDRSSVAAVPASAVAAVLDATARSHDVVVVDLPRRADEVAAAVLARARSIFVVVPAELRAAIAATQTLAWLVPGSGARLVVRTGRGRSVDPAQMAAALDLPLAAVIADDARVAAAIESGGLPEAPTRTALARVADALVSEACRLRTGEAA